MKYSKSDIANELLREIHVREQVFPRWIQIKRLTQSKANYRIDCFRKAHDLITRGESALNIPFPEVINEMHRELKMRHKVYAKKVQQNKLHPSLAQKRVALLQNAISILAGREMQPAAEQKSLFV